MIALLLWAAARMGAAEGRAEIVLDAAWKVQPAQGPDVAPVSGQWGTAADGIWAPGAVTPHASWRAADISAANDAWYEQSVDIPADWAGKRVVLDFRRIEGDALVWINGDRIGELRRPGGELDVTSHVRPGAPNVLRVFVTRMYHGISRRFTEDLLRYRLRKNDPSPVKWGLGLTAPVRLKALPANVSLHDVTVLPSWREHHLSLEVEIDAARAETGVAIGAVVTDANGAEVLRLNGAETNLPAGRSRLQLAESWRNPIPWELDAPYLYHVKVQLQQAGQLVDELKPIRFGFREIWTEGRVLMMNGHPSRWRLGWLRGGGTAALSFFRLMNYNVYQVQPASAAWWRDGRETFVMDEEMLDRMDEFGIGASIPTPTIGMLGAELADDTPLRRQYAAEMEYYLRHYRNHPCILAWAVGMNTFNPKPAVHPDGMGRRMAPPLPDPARTIESVVTLVHGLDPTRLVYSHADGNLGDIASANVYLNFVPLQEREEWPMAWARDGDMPYMAAEMGEPYVANFWKGRQFLLTEYLASYLGAAAYQTETVDGLRGTVRTSLANVSGHGDWSALNVANFPAYWDFERLFMTATERAWRTWNVNAGRMYWISVDTGWGDPPGFSGRSVTRYAALKTPVTARPAWANPYFDICRDANMPLLAYIAGAPTATDKTHAFWARETIAKQVALVWDGPGVKKVGVRWWLEGPERRAVAEGMNEVTLQPGDVRFVPFQVEAPEVTARTEFQLRAEIASDGRTEATDTLAVQVFPREQPPAIPARIALWDPRNTSADVLRRAGIAATPWKPGASLAQVDLLVIGREALQPGAAFPVSAREVAEGAKVLVLEQSPQTWEAMGFDTTDLLTRYVFCPSPTGGLMAGLAPADLINWRGNATLVPEGRAARQSNVQHAPRWTNRHAVASTVLRTPAIVGITPLLVAEFDLSYSPLLLWRFERGAVCCSSLDFTGRVDADPAPTRLLRNVVDTLLALREPARRIAYSGGARGAATLTTLNADFATAGRDIPGQTLLVVGDSSDGKPPMSEAEEDKLADGGTHVLALPMSAAVAQSAGFAVEEAVRWKATPAPTTLSLAGIGPDLLRWRAALPAAVFRPRPTDTAAQVLADGLVLERKVGRGVVTHVQVDPDALTAPFAGRIDEMTAIQLSVMRIRQLQARIATNLGAGVSAAMARRLTTLSRIPEYETLGHWQVLGPFVVPTGENRAGYLQHPLSGEASAVAGDTNPNLSYPNGTGQLLNWRTTALAGADGFVDLGRACGRDQLAVAYATRAVQSETERVATLRVGGDFYFMVWVNGQKVFETLKGHSPTAAQFILRVPLRQGDNVVTFKVMAGSKGFGFWADLSRADQAPEQTVKTVPLAPLYQPWTRDFDPYEFSYW